MNKLEGNISLFVITFFAAIQYVFLAWVPDSLSHFAFLCVTNLAGFLITLPFFFGELFRMDRKQLKESLVLSLELIVFNVFLLLGVEGVGPTVTGAVISAYFVFIIILSVPLFHQWPDKTSLWGCSLVLLGLFFIMDADVVGLWNKDILYLIIADLAFALYILSTGQYASSSNPSILAMGQMLFCFLIALALWIGESVFFQRPFSLPANLEFWGSVVYISIFIRGLYGVIQVYAQRYVTPLNTSLIFSTEIIITMAASPFLSRLFGITPERITPMRILGSAVMVAGLFMVDPAFLKTLKKVWQNRTLASLRPVSHESHERKASKHYLFYIPLCAALFGACGLLIGNTQVAFIYGFLGLLAGFPVAILMEGILYVDLFSRPDDVAFEVSSGPESLLKANEILEQSAREHGISLKRVFELQSCLEEFAIRIVNHLPSARIGVRIQYGDATSVRLSWRGERLNPLHIRKNEDEIEVAGLKIIQHRALRASFHYRDGENKIHIVL